MKSRVQDTWGRLFSTKCPYKGTLGGLENTSMFYVTLINSHFYLKYWSWTGRGS